MIEMNGTRDESVDFGLPLSPWRIVGGQSIPTLNASVVIDVREPGSRSVTSLFSEASVVWPKSTTAWPKLVSVSQSKEWNYCRFPGFNLVTGILGAS